MSKIKIGLLQISETKIAAALPEIAADSALFVDPLSPSQLMALIAASLVISLGVNDPIKTWLMSRLPSGA